MELSPKFGKLIAWQTSLNVQVLQQTFYNIPYHLKLSIMFQEANMFKNMCKLNPAKLNANFLKIIFTTVRYRTKKDTFKDGLKSYAMH